MGDETCTTEGALPLEEAETSEMLGLAERKRALLKRFEAEHAAGQVAGTRPSRVDPKILPTKDFFASGSVLREFRAFR